MKKSLIGITCPWSVETWGDSIEDRGYFYAGSVYAEAVEKYGGIPILIPPVYETDKIDETVANILERVDGILFTGGGDVKRKSGDSIGNLRSQQPRRYDFEQALMRLAFKKGKPILGICRGFQMIIESFGGLLSEELVDNHMQNKATYETWHNVRLNEKSNLYNVIGAESIAVNSFHVQKLGLLPPEFIAAATADDEVVESIEYSGKNFVAGYQFHPEELVRANEIFGGIFKSFIKAAEK